MKTIGHSKNTSRLASLLFCTMALTSACGGGGGDDDDGLLPSGGSSGIDTERSTSADIGGSIASLTALDANGATVQTNCDLPQGDILACYSDPDDGEEGAAFQCRTVDQASCSFAIDGDPGLTPHPLAIIFVQDANGDGSRSGDVMVDLSGEEAITVCDGDSISITGVNLDFATSKATAASVTKTIDGC